MTNNMLDSIVAQKLIEIEAMLQKTPEKNLRQDALKPRKRRRFFEKLEKPGNAGINIIAEIKRASPSKGLMCQNLDPSALAKNYESGGAACLSVLTDNKFFSGSIQDLESARSATLLPVLRKDFLVSPCQLFESCIMGADAVLLIARILSAKALKDLLDLSIELELDALVEVHSEKDVESAILSGAKLIGINNRNLETFHTDISNSARLVSMLETDQIPVAASGIRSREDIDRLLGCGIFNFLIGESLVKSKDPAVFLQSLMGKTILKE